MAAEFHRGRILDHVHLHSADLKASRRFYQAVVDSLGYAAAFSESPDHFVIDELFVDGDTKAKATHIHLAFQAPDRETVDRFHKAGLAAGGRDNGKPCEREYHPGYYAAFLLDPDGNNIEAVFHGPAKRSAESVVITQG